MVNDSDYTLEVNDVGWGLTQQGFLHYLKPPKPLITIITLWVLIYCCELSLTLAFAFSSPSNCFAQIFCSVPPIRPTCMWSSGRVGSWFNDMLHSLWLSQQEGLSPAASCQWRASGVVQPIIRQQKAQPTSSPFFTVGAVAYSSFEFYCILNIIQGVWLEWIPNSPKVCRIKIRVVKMSHIHLFIWWESVIIWAFVLRYQAVNTFAEF